MFPIKPRISKSVLLLSILRLNLVLSVVGEPQKSDNTQCLKQILIKTSIMSPELDPSESLPVEDQLFELLRNKELRIMYRNCLNSCRQFHHADAKAWFLKKLMDNKIIPSSYKIRNSSIDQKASEAASLASMGRDLEIAKTEALVHMDTMTSVYNALAVLTPVSLREQLLNKIRGRGLGFQFKFKSEKQNLDGLD